MMVVEEKEPYKAGEHRELVPALVERVRAKEEPVSEEVEPLVKIEETEKDVEEEEVLQGERDLVQLTTTKEEEVFQKEAMPPQVGQVCDVEMENVVEEEVLQEETMPPQVGRVRAKEMPSVVQLT